MPKRQRDERLLAYEIRPSGEILTHRMEVDIHSVMRQRERDEAVILLAPPVNYTPGVKIWRWSKGVHPCAAYFSGDGEALDWVSGPGDDWRVQPDDADTMEEEELERTYAALVEERYAALDEEASLVALHRAIMNRPVNANPYSALITTACVAVAVVLVLLAYSYVQAQGGLSETLDVQAIFSGGQQ